jgi:hypothetical protein
MHNSGTSYRPAGGGAAPAQYPPRRAGCAPRPASRSRRACAAAWSCRSPKGRAAQRIRRGIYRATRDRPRPRRRSACSRPRTAPAGAPQGRSTARRHVARRACSAYSARSSRWRRPQPSATLTAGDRLLNSVACPIETDTPVRYRLSTHAIAAETAGQETWLLRLDRHQCCFPGLAAEC